MTTSVGRNAPCPCGSGAKYKYCCLHKKGRQDTEAAPEMRERDGGSSVEAGGGDDQGPGIDEAPSLVESMEVSTDDDEKTPYYGTEEGFAQWQKIEERFHDADLDEKFRMGKELVEKDPHFDGECVFWLFIEELMGPSEQNDRRPDWLDLLDQLQKSRPELAYEQAPWLARPAVKFALIEEQREIEPYLDLLFDDPVKHVESIIDIMKVLAYHGAVDVLDRLRLAWPTIADSSVYVVDPWAQWTLLMQVAALADDDIARSRTTAEVTESLGDTMDALNDREVAIFVEGFVGDSPLNYDREAEAEWDDESERATALSLAYARHLVDEQGWPSSKALLAAHFVGRFLEYNAAVDDPFQAEHRTSASSRSKAVHRELKQLRAPWRAAHPFAPHPDLATGYVERVKSSSMLGSYYTAAAFFEAICKLAPWMEQHGFIDNPELTQGIQHYFQRRVSEIVEAIGSYAGADPICEKDLADLVRWFSDGGE